jgi:lipoprotein-anchoring transpeptidase ErfK/SrfK
VQAIFRVRQKIQEYSLGFAPRDTRTLGIESISILDAPVAQAGNSILMYLTVRPPSCGGHSQQVSTRGRHHLRRRIAAALGALVVLAAMVAAMPRALADPELNVSTPGDPPTASSVDPIDGPSLDKQVAPSDAPPVAYPPSPLSIPVGTPAGQDPTPFIGAAPFTPPTVHPANGATVGIAMPIVINFGAPITDQGAAEQAIHISSDPPVPGKFYWMSDSQVRWRPFDFWPAHTVVNIDAAGTTSSFSTGDALVAMADNSTHMMTITRNGDVEQTFPISMGKPGHDTPNGTYYVQGKSPDVVMDSATYGVPNTSPEGYRVHVQLAVRFDNSGNFVHSAPWSVADQGNRNVSHGCINVSPSDAKWFYDNFDAGDPIVVTNSVDSQTQYDGAQDWQL